MNIIANDCTGGYIYKNFLQEDYKNPFIWSGMNLKDFEFLIKNYDTINFKNIEIKTLKKLKNFFVIIDNKLKVRYNHYIFDMDCDVPVYKDRDVYYNRIWEYLYEKYNSRLKRMTEKPVFIGHYDYPAIKTKFDPELSEKRLNELCDYVVKMHIPFLLISQIKVEQKETDTFKIVYFNTYKKTYSKGPEDLLKDYKNEIDLKLNELKAYIKNN